MPDVILLEVTLRDIDGYDVLQRLKSDPKTTDIPVIVITALSDLHSRELSISLGAEQHIAKPWEGGQIEAAVANALAKTRSG